MSDYNRGRADATAGKYDPPDHFLGGLLESKSEWEDIAERKEEYREGYHDKKNEMEDDK